YLIPVKQFLKKIHYNSILLDSASCRCGQFNRVVMFEVMLITAVDSDQLMQPGDDEIKDGQWLGVTVRSMGPGKKVMVCAHRYMRKGSDYQWGQGLCYTLSQFLDYDETWEPCKGRPTNSGLLMDDMAVIGSPGPYTWRGTVFVISMAVTAGHFFGDKMAYAAGAPRANGTGQVVLFTPKNHSVNPMAVKLILKGEQFASSFGYELTTADVNGDNQEEGGAVYIYLNNKHRCLDCNKPIKLTGKLESRFGFAITNLGDLNQDGFEDIAVGAPYEGNGVVYIYLGSENGIIQEPSQKIHARDLRTDIPMRTFGYSLSGGLDLDKNGYPDLMIGAYDVDAVVFLQARPIINIVTSVQPLANLQNIDPSRPGCPKDPNSNYTCFSFAACVSMKLTTSLNLSYAIEAETFQSGRKFSRVWFKGSEADKKQPNIVRKTIHMKHDPYRLRGEEYEKCETEIVYLKENQLDIQSPIKFQMTYKLIQREPPLLRSGDPLPNIDNYPVLNQQEAAKVFQATFQNDCGNEICESQLNVDTLLLLPSGRRPNTWDLIMGEHPVVRLNVSVENAGESAYDAWLFVSHPASLNYTSHKTESKHMSCTPHNKTLIKCNIGNPFKKDTPANIQLRFDPKGLADSDSHLEFVVFANSTSKEIYPQDPLILHTNVIRRAEISVSGIVDPDHMYYGGAVRGETSLEYLDEIGDRVTHIYQVHNKGPWKVGSLELHIEWPFQVANNRPQGKWLFYLEDRPVVEAQGGGECFIPESQVNPLNLARRPGMEEHPLEALTLPGGPLLSTLDSPEPTENTENSETRRRKRDVEMIVRAETYVDKSGNKHEVVNMHEKHRPVRGLSLVASRPLSKAATHLATVLYGSARAPTASKSCALWNSTLVEDYPKVESVKIRSRAKMFLPPSLMIHQNTSDDEAQVETVAYPDPLDQQEPEPVPIWIIIVAVVVGLVLLILLILVLWVLGFFVRRRPDPTLSGNLEKHRDENGDYS
ncbi:Integrin alpha-PS1, partial [Blattella germanica]